ncbi:uncharacterized protein STEHIDRAFT_116150 [Stereum hirsutum FP-91666 SS1]|uniref:Peptidase C14 caspase domain-containing protein n=1 Tax=Stereum hirsutum (strain FP-91666) TaxID=721885 RepID=R7RX79_STEHR|nr:uncharacterized protein STEHIDRAFT_116150 [Stereum hirsutum FP-91666 SS1]EIM79949.1 hypothetical protein STEHIDRAFT_116150 [Stereum hirsutum FP-91666 SS1]
MSLMSQSGTDIPEECTCDEEAISAYSTSPGPQAPKVFANMFALIIGVHTYQNPSGSIKPLPGACADVRKMKAFLLSMNVPEARIKMLRNREATHDSIIKELYHVANNRGIEYNNPILIYFAGHGTRVPAGEESSKVMIEMLCPYDFLSRNGETRGILDIVLAEHLNSISKAKGNNITVVLDCCHSGSGTRKVPGGDQEKLTMRSVEFAPDWKNTSMAHFTAGTRATQKASVSGKHTKLAEDTLLGTFSHVLLAACSAQQSSSEAIAGGKFTTELLRALQRLDTDQLTYRRLIEDLPDIPDQHPQCEGFNRDRNIFTTITPNPEDDFYKLTLIPDTCQFTFDDDDVREDDKYAIHGDHDESAERPFICKATVESVVISTAVNSTAVMIVDDPGVIHKKSNPLYAYPVNVGSISQKPSGSGYALTRTTTYQLSAGEAYGIYVGAEFDVHTARSRDTSSILGKFVVQSTTNYKAKLIYTWSHDSTPGTPPEAWGRQTQVGPGHDFHLGIPAELSYIAKVVQSMRLGQYKNILANIHTPPGDQDMLTLVKNHDNMIAFEHHENPGPEDKTMRLLNPVCFELEKTARRVVNADSDLVVGADSDTVVNPDFIIVISGAADFFTYLRRQPPSSYFFEKGKERVFLECYELQGDCKMIPKDDKNDLIGEKCRLGLDDDGKKRAYGFKIVNKDTRPLYAALFYFDMLDLSIRSYHQPGAARDGHVDHCVLAQDSLTIGYAQGGSGDPRGYRVRQGQKVEVGYLKLFVSTQWVDYSGIAQTSPFNGGRRGDYQYTPDNSPWDSLVVPVVLKRVLRSVKT